MEEVPAPEHRLMMRQACSLANSPHRFSEGFVRAVCTCGWKSAPAPDGGQPEELFRGHLYQTRKAVTQ